MTASEAEVADRYQIDQQDLQSDEAEDQGDRLVEVAEAPYEQVHEREEGDEANEREGRSRFRSRPRRA